MAPDQTGLATASVRIITIVCFFCLKWLNDGVFYRTRETEVGWGKSSLQEDCEHVLIAIIEGLEDELKWPDEEERAQLTVTYEGIF